MADLQKALQMAEARALVPEQIEPEIYDLVVKNAPLLKLFNEIDWDTNVYQWNERTALVGASAYDENDVFAAGESVYTRKSVEIKMIKADGAVSNMVVEASRRFVNALQAEIEAASTSLGYEIERLYIQGNSRTNPKEFDGLSVQVTKVHDAACSPISLDILDAAINKVEVDGGRPNLIVLSFRDLQAVHKIMRSLMTYEWQKVEIAAGVLLTHYRGIPLYASSFVPIDANKLSEAYVLDTTRIVVPVLKRIQYEDMTPKVTTDASAFRIKTWRALAVKGGGVFHCKITRIGE